LKTASDITVRVITVFKNGSDVINTLVVPYVRDAESKDGRWYKDDVAREPCEGTLQGIPRLLKLL
jgi:hypothetical protein